VKVATNAGCDASGQDDPRANAQRNERERDCERHQLDLNPLSRRVTFVPYLDWLADGHGFLPFSAKSAAVQSRVMGRRCPQPTNKPPSIISFSEIE
jgi:hypothetical protein